jgi:hypothetical protein
MPRSLSAYCKAFSGHKSSEILRGNTRYIEAQLALGSKSLILFLISHSLNSFKMRIQCGADFIASCLPKHLVSRNSRKSSAHHVSLECSKLQQSALITRRGIHRTSTNPFFFLVALSPPFLIYPAKERLTRFQLPDRKRWEGGPEWKVNLIEHGKYAPPLLMHILHELYRSYSVVLYLCILILAKESIIILCCASKIHPLFERHRGFKSLHICAANATCLPFRD